MMSLVEIQTMLALWKNKIAVKTKTKNEAKGCYYHEAYTIYCNHTKVVYSSMLAFPSTV